MYDDWTAPLALHCPLILVVLPLVALCHCLQGFWDPIGRAPVKSINGKRRRARWWGSKHSLRPATCTHLACAVQEPRSLHLLQATLNRGCPPHYTPPGEYNPFQVNIVSCSNGALKLEWSSSKAGRCYKPSLEQQQLQQGCQPCGWGLPVCRDLMRQPSAVLPPTT